MTNGEIIVYYFTKEIVCQVMVDKLHGICYDKRKLGERGSVMNEEKILQAIADMGASIAALDAKTMGAIAALENRMNERFDRLEDDFDQLKDETKVTRETANQILEWSEWVSPSLSELVREDAHSN